VDAGLSDGTASYVVEFAREVRVDDVIDPLAGVHLAADLRLERKVFVEELASRRVPENRPDPGRSVSSEALVCASLPILTTNS
jgi:hypothetical protein